ncbi:hypothetical protein D3C78_1362870 [compost metagenome]
MIRKIQCQVRYCTIQPPMVGPINGPSRPGMVINPMIRTSSERGYARSTTRRPTGSISAPPRPWITRAPISMLNDSDSAHSTEPKLNSTMAPKKIFRVPKRSAIQPDAGISKATVSM